MIVTTETGSKYEFKDDIISKLVRRVNPEGALRRDSEWLKYDMSLEPEVGYPMLLWLEPLGDGFATMRQTSAVTEIQP